MFIIGDGRHLSKFDRIFFKYSLNNITSHSSEIRGLRSTKCSSETLQNLLYFMHKKTHVVFFRFSFRATLYFYLINALVYVDRKKTSWVFLCIKYSKF